MDELLQKAKERREQLRRELEAIDKFIHDYTVNVAPERRSPDYDPHDDLFNDSKGRRVARAQAVNAMMDEAERYIIRAGRPMTRFQLLDYLVSAGHHIEGGDPSKVLGTNIWRSRRFHNIEGVGYWPKSAPIPAPYVGRPIRETSLS
ncbi:hypothetical protein U1872_11320 [Sphingomonas sp. RB3P16]|uniref:hypothetical protein n=1 Tax=Parasphingomonas frigoris TaxID=3096163 RepID=UPI002FC72D9C